MRPIDLGVKISNVKAMEHLVIENGFQAITDAPMIMKLHTLAFHESGMCFIDFGAKRSKVKAMWY